MNNYYEYCKDISRNYYPRIYKELNEDIEKVIKSKSEEILMPFPNHEQFKLIVEEVYCVYKERVYKDINENRVDYVNFLNNDLTKNLKDMISILMINNLLQTRKYMKDYPCYY